MTEEPAAPEHEGEATASPDAAPPEVPLTLAAVGNGLRTLAGRLDAVEDHTVGAATDFADLVQRVDALGLAVDALVKKDRTPIRPEPWAKRATPQHWVELTNWVDWFNSSYEMIGDQIPPCWPAHPGVVEEIAGLWRAWAHAVIADTRAKQAGATDLTAWHDRWLWPAIRRLRADHYEISHCRPGAHESRKRSISPTDRSLLPGDAVASPGHPGSPAVHLDK